MGSEKVNGKEKLEKIIWFHFFIKITTKIQSYQ